MSTASRIIATILIGVTGAANQPIDTAETTPIEIDFSQAPVISERPSQPLAVIGGSPEDHARLDGAIGLFAAEGLRLPPLIVEFSEDRTACAHNMGIYRKATWSNDIATDYIAICSSVRLDLVHELAHAWEQHNLSDTTRQAFMDLWGLEHWLSHEVDWRQRGGEKAANTIAFGLIVDYATDNNDILRFVCGYPMLTGQQLPHADIIDCSESEPSFTQESVASDFSNSRKPL